MNELTIEEKAKRYDEAIEIARKIKNGEPINVPNGTGIPDVIFPELNETDDEEIRKLIISLIEWSKSYYASGISNDDAKKMLVWIKKIGEQKPVWSEYDEHIVKDIIYFLNEAKVQYANTIELEGCIHWLWSLLQRMGR